MSNIHVYPAAILGKGGDTITLERSKTNPEIFSGALYMLCQGQQFQRIRSDTPLPLASDLCEVFALSSRSGSRTFMFVEPQSLWLRDGCSARRWCIFAALVLSTSLDYYSGGGGTTAGELARTKPRTGMYITPEDFQTLLMDHPDYDFQRKWEAYHRRPCTNIR